MSVRDRVFLITGGGGAIARPIVRTFAAAGAQVVVVDRTEEIARPAADEVNGLALAADLTTATGAETMVQAAVAARGRVDGLIHTVGGFTMGRLEEADAAAYDRMFDLNVRTLFFALRAVVPHLRRANAGFVAAFSSEPGWSGAAPGSALYGASKAAVATLLRSLDGELGGTAVAVSIVYPMGAVDTPANRRDMPSVDPATFIDPQEIAETLLHAASRSSRGRLVELPIWPPRKG